MLDDDASDTINQADAEKWQAMTQALSLFDRGYLPMAGSTLHPERASNA
jgi:hypothetical protein